MSVNYYDNPYFSEDELACKGSRQLVLHPGFLGALIHLRKEWESPLIVNCCCRSPEHNAEVGGAKHSYHLTEQEDVETWLGTLAIDISERSFESDTKWKEFNEVAGDMGWSVGYYSWGTHIDMRILTGKDRVEFKGGY